MIMNRMIVIRKAGEQKYAGRGRGTEREREIMMIDWSISITYYQLVITPLTTYCQLVITPLMTYHQLVITLTIHKDRQSTFTLPFFFFSTSVMKQKLTGLWIFLLVGKY